MQSSGTATHTRQATIESLWIVERQRQRASWSTWPKVWADAEKTSLIPVRRWYDAMPHAFCTLAPVPCPGSHGFSQPIDGGPAAASLRMWSSRGRKWTGLEAQRSSLNLSIAAVSLRRPWILPRLIQTQNTMLARCLAGHMRPSEPRAFLASCCKKQSRVDTLVMLQHL